MAKLAAERNSALSVAPAILSPVLFLLLLAAPPAAADTIVGLPACVNPTDANCALPTPGGFTVVALPPSVYSSGSASEAVIYGLLANGSVVYEYALFNPSSSIPDFLAEADSVVACAASATPCTALNPGGAVVITNSTTYEVALVDTPLTQRVDQYQTTLTAVLNGAQTVFQETFALPYSDPAVQAALLEAQSILSTDQATYGSPNLTSNSTVLEGSQDTYIQTGQNVVLTDNTTSAYGPAVILVGSDLSEVFNVLAGQIDINVNDDFAVTIDRNAVTTDTYLTTQSYELDGTTQSPSVPEPKSALLLAAALFALAAAKLRSAGRRIVCPTTDATPRWGRRFACPVERRSTAGAGLILLALFLPKPASADAIIAPNACLPTVVAPCYIANLTGPVLITDPSQVTFTIGTSAGIEGQDATDSSTYFGADGELAADPVPPQTQNQNAAAALLLAGVPPDPNPGTATVITNSITTYVSGYVDTPVTQRVDQYSTTIQAVLNGGTTVYNQTFSVPYGDPAVQAAIALADSILAGDSATYGSPYQTANSTVLTGSQLTYQVTGQSFSGVVEISTSNDFGPYYVAVGDNESELFFVLPGQLDINVTDELFYNTDRNAITTNTYLTSQTYEIDGTTQSPTVPEPKSALLLLAAALVFLAARKRARVATSRSLVAPAILSPVLFLLAAPPASADAVIATNACLTVVVAPCYIANLSGPLLITDPSQVNFTINVGVNDINGQNAAGATAVYYDANGGLAADPTPPQTQNQNNAAALLASGNAPIALNPGGPVIVTNSTTTYVSGYVDTPVAQRVDQYSTTIEAVLNGGSTVYNQTFSVPYGDPTVQAAIALADSILAGDSATYGSPYQTANSTVLTGSQLTYQVTGQSLSGAVESSTFSTFGPDYVAVGDNQSELFVILAGQIDINLNNEFFYNTDRNAITTNTYLTSQTYEIDGSTQSPTVPEPKSALLLLAAAALLWVARTRRRALCNASGLCRRFFSIAPLLQPHPPLQLPKRRPGLHPIPIHRRFDLLDPVLLPAVRLPQIRHRVYRP